MTTRDPGTLHLWLVAVGASTEHLDEYRAWLNEHERAQERRFFFARDQRRYLVTRVLVRRVLSRYCGLEPAALIFSRNAYGRPQLDNAEAASLQLSFNVSHTRDLVVLGVTRMRSLGVDVESLTERPAAIDIARQYFSPSEVTDLAALPESDQAARFFDLWTLKESYIKARGMGLSLPLHEFSFAMSGRQISFAAQAQLDDDPTRWLFWQIDLERGNRLAVCAERRVEANTRMEFHRVTSSMAEETFWPAVLRCSDSC